MRHRMIIVASKNLFIQDFAFNFVPMKSEASALK